MSVQISINGESRELENDLSLEDLLAKLDLDVQGRGIAVALNAQVVPRGTWDTTRLAEGDRVEVLTATQGG